jgi:L-alanine-DL-glutamate epimerase-like enolase superfamily enzyme
MAIWDLVSKIEEKPLYQLLAERYGNGKPNKTVFVYAAGGYYWPNQGLTGLTDEIKKYLDLGYSVVKKRSEEHLYQKIVKELKLFLKF